MSRNISETTEDISLVYSAGQDNSVKKISHIKVILHGIEKFIICEERIKFNSKLTKVIFFTKDREENCSAGLSDGHSLSLR